MFAMIVVGAVGAALAPVPNARATTPTAAPGVTVSPGAVAPRAFDHVWIYVLENTTYDEVTAQSMPYFSSLAGVHLTKMYGVAHQSLGNYIAMASGHAPNAATKADCLQYNCLYDIGEDENIADQLEAAGLTWKAYMDGMAKPCATPKEGALDAYLVGYATRHNPFMYYRGIVDDTSRCAAHVRPFPDLAKDQAAGNVANYNFIAPDTCHDGHDDSKAGCKLTDADNWLRQQLPAVLASTAYRDGGAVFVTFDEAESADTSSCCGGIGGGHIATAVMSPMLRTPAASAADAPYSHYSLLRTVEDDFGLSCLRRACDASTRSMMGLFRPAVAAPTTTAVPASTTTKRAAGAPATTSKSNSSTKTLLWLMGAILVLIAAASVVGTRRAAKKLRSD